MASDVVVKITLTKGIGKIGFGIPLILVSNASTAKAYTEYTDIDALKTDYPDTTDAYKVASLIWQQEEAPSKIAVCSSTSKATEALADIYHEGWRQLITLLGESQDSTVAEVATYMEGKGDRLYFTSFESTSALTTALGSSKPTRTVAMVYGGSTDFPEAALVGATAGRDAGSFTYKNIILKGVAPEELTDAQITAAHTAGGICFVTKAGDNVTSEGTTVGGEYIDIIDCKDYIIQQIVYKTQKLLNTMPKVPYDNRGIAMLETQCLDVLKDAYGMGIIATNDEGLPDYSTNYALRSEVPAGDRAERKYLSGKFSFGLAGAIHHVEIKGEIIV